MDQVLHYKIDENRINYQSNNQFNNQLCKEITCVITVLTCGCTILSLLIISTIEKDLNFNFTI